MKHHWQRLRVASRAFNIARTDTQYVVLVTKLLGSYCGAHPMESYSKESNTSDTNWLISC